MRITVLVVLAALATGCDSSEPCDILDPRSCASQGGGLCVAVDDTTSGACVGDVRPGDDGDDRVLDGAGNVTARIDPLGDVDVYYFSAPEIGRYSLGLWTWAAEQGAEQLEVRVTFHDRAGVIDAEVDWPPSQTVQLSFTAWQPGIYYVVVQPDVMVTGTYQLAYGPGETWELPAP